MEADDFIKKFHNLEGTLLKEKKRALFQLLDSHKSLLSNDNLLQTINKKLIPTTYLEETYKLEFLLYFQRSTELLELLKTGNDTAVNKIIRKSWFQKTLTASLKNGDFLQNVFPQLSALVRSKMLRQIIKQIRNEEFVDDQFDKLLESYGIKTATIILSACSTDKIKKILLNWGLTLPKSELKLLHDRDSSLINFYYEEYHRRGGNMNDLKDFSKYLSHKDPNRFVELLLKYEFDSFKLGRRKTKKYILEHKEVILNNPQLYLRMDIFQKHSLVKQLGDDFPVFLKLTFPKYLPDLMTSNVFELLNLYQKKKRYELYRTTFENIYKKQLFDHKEFITEDLLQVIQDDIEREKWVVEKFENHVKYIKYKRSSLAVPELKEKLIANDNIECQKQLLKYIVTSCGISEDYNELLDILKLFCNRFKKRDGSFFSAFLDAIHGQFKLETLTEEHWKYIHELILIQYKRNMPINGTIVFEYSKHLYKTGKEFDEIMPIYLSTAVLLKNLKFKNETFKDEGFEKKFLTLVLKYYCLEKTKDDFTNDIISAIKKWNEKHPNNVMLVSRNKFILHSVKKSVNLHWIFTPGEDFSSMKYLVCRENMAEEFVEAYFHPVNCLEGVTITRWFLKYQPNIFRSKIDKIIRLMSVSNTRYLMKFLKKYEHIGLVQTTIKYYIQKLKNTKEEEKNNIAQLLASIMPSKDYLSLMEEYTPLNDKFNEILREKNLHLIRVALATSLRFSNYHADALPVILKYCKDDYFKHSLFSLYYCLNRTPEKSLEKVSDILLQNPIEVGKHVYILAALVFPMKTNAELGLKIIDTDKNSAVRKLIASFYHKYFVKNAQEPFFKILQICMNDLSLKEKRTLNSLANVHIVPEKYKCELMRQVCQLFDTLEESEKTSMHIYYNKLMSSVKDYDMKFLSSELCVDIISKRLFMKEYKKNHACLEFATKFLMHGVKMEENIEQFLTLLKLYKQKHWNGPYGLNARSVIHSICKYIFDKTVERKKLRSPVSKEFPSIFSEAWRKVFSIQDTFEEYLMLDFMLIQYESNDNLTLFAKEISKIYEDLRINYGDIIITYFKNFLSQFLIQLLGDNYDLKLMKLLAEILKISNTLPCRLLVVQLLPHYRFDDEYIENFSYVIEKLQTDRILEVHLNIYYRDKIDASALYGKRNN